MALACRQDEKTVRGIEKLVEELVKLPVGQNSPLTGFEHKHAHNGSGHASHKRIILSSAKLLVKLFFMVSDDQPVHSSTRVYERKILCKARKGKARQGKARQGDLKAS